MLRVTLLVVACAALIGNCAEIDGESTTVTIKDIEVATESLGIELRSDEIVTIKNVESSMATDEEATTTSSVVNSVNSVANTSVVIKLTEFSDDGREDKVEDVVLKNETTIETLSEVPKVVAFETSDTEAVTTSNSVGDTDSPTEFSNHNADTTISTNAHVNIRFPKLMEVDRNQLIVTKKDFVIEEVATEPPATELTTIEALITTPDLIVKTISRDEVPKAENFTEAVETTTINAVKDIEELTTTSSVETIKEVIVKETTISETVKPAIEEAPTTIRDERVTEPTIKLDTVTFVDIEPTTTEPSLIVATIKSESESERKVKSLESDLETPTTTSSPILITMFSDVLRTAEGPVDMFAEEAISTSRPAVESIKSEDSDRDLTTIRPEAEAITLPAGLPVTTSEPLTTVNDDNWHRDAFTGRVNEITPSATESVPIAATIETIRETIKETKPSEEDDQHSSTSTSTSTISPVDTEEEEPVITETNVIVVNGERVGKKLDSKDVEEKRKMLDEARDEDGDDFDEDEKQNEVKPLTEEEASGHGPSAKAGDPTRPPTRYRDAELLVAALGLLVLTLGASLVSHLLFEKPLRRLLALCKKSRRKDVYATNSVPIKVGVLPDMMESKMDIENENQNNSNQHQLDMKCLKPNARVGCCPPTTVEGAEAMMKKPAEELMVKLAGEESARGPQDSAVESSLVEVTSDVGVNGGQVNDAFVLDEVVTPSHDNQEKDTDESVVELETVVVRL